MIATWYNLAWKEWREHRWKLLALLAIVMSLQLALWGDSRPGDFIGPMISMFMLYLPLGAAFIAMGVAASERSAGTLPLVRSLPIDLRKLAIVKLLVGIATVVTPALVSIGVVAGLMKIGAIYDWPGVRAGLRTFAHQPMLFGEANWPLNLALLVIAIVTSFVLWVAACGVNRESEVRAGAIGLVVVVTLWAMLAYSSYLLHELLIVNLEHTSLWPFAPAALPGGVAILFMDVRNDMRWWLTGIAGFLTTHGPLAAWYILRFGRTERAGRWSPQPATSTQLKPAWLAAPRRTPLSAISWKQFRESAPIVLAGLAGAVGVLVVFTISTWREASSHYWDSKPNYWPVQYAGVATTFFAVFGFLAGLISGVGMAATDFEAKHFTFWRSRPINVDLWFWTKFLIGLVMLLLAFGLPTLFGINYLVTHDEYGQFIGDSNTASSALAFSTALAYSAAVLAGCLLRHTIYAAIIGLGLSIMILTISLENISGIVAQSGVLIGACLLLTLAAWIAVRKDWALRR